MDSASGIRETAPVRRARREQENLVRDLRTEIMVWKQILTEYARGSARELGANRAHGQADKRSANKARASGVLCLWRWRVLVGPDRRRFSDIWF